MKYHVKSRFRWKDGFIDFRTLPKNFRWKRFRWDRDDVPVERRMELLHGCLNYSNSTGVLVDVVEFERIDLPDGSFEFVEILGVTGTPGLRDTEHPCTSFKKGDRTVFNDIFNDCLGDGHYLCEECIEHKNCLEKEK